MKTRVILLSLTILVAAAISDDSTLTPHSGVHRARRYYYHEDRNQDIGGSTNNGRGEGPSSFSQGNSAYSSGQSPTGYGQPGFQQPGYEQPGYQQPGYGQPGYQQPGYEQLGHGQPGPVQGSANNYDQGRQLYRQQAQSGFGGQHLGGYQQHGY